MKPKLCQAIIGLGLNIIYQNWFNYLVCFFYCIFSPKPKLVLVMVEQNIEGGCNISLVCDHCA